jgi:hypothetical protein
MVAALPKGINILVTIAAGLGRFEFAGTKIMS